MCTQPKKILYRSNHFDVVQHPLYLTVPCGHCEECAIQQRNDWFVRCYFEYLENQGRTFFYTLTYNDEHLPHYGKVHGFSKRHIQLFIKRLRKQLDVVGISLKYLVSCEYGELRQRPHYHALFFLSQWYNPFTFYKLVEYEWSTYVRSEKKRVSLGFVKPGDNVGVVRGTTGIQYVTKYVVKDISYVSSHITYIQNWLHNRYTVLFKYCKSRFHYEFDLPSYKSNGRKFYIFKRPDNFDELPSIQQKVTMSFVNKFNSILCSALPFHLQSSQLGLGAFKKVKQGELHQYNIFKSIDKKNWKLPVLQHDGFYEYRIPRYIQRKLWFDCLENETDGKKNRFVLNEHGISHKIEMLETSIKLREEEIDSCVYGAHYLTDKDDELLMMVNSALPNAAFSSVRDLQYFVEHIDIPSRNLAIYDVVYRGRICDVDLDDLKDEQILFDSYPDVYEYHLRAFSFVDLGKIYKYERHLLKALEMRLFDNLQILKPYELCCIVLDSLQIALRKQCEYQRSKRERDVRYLRQLYKTF